MSRQRHRSFRNFLVSSDAVAATEFVIILPIMLALIGGITEFGRFIIAINQVNRLASRFAITYSDCSDSPQGSSSPCNTELQNYYGSTTAQQNMAPQLSTTSPPVLRMFQVTMSSSNSPTVNYNLPNATSLSSSEQTVAQTVIGASQVGVIVTVQYTHTLMFFTAMSSVLPASLLTFTYTVGQRKS